MGLDVSHNCWHGAYSAFSRWREKLADVAGFPIVEPTWEEREAIIAEHGIDADPGRRYVDLNWDDIAEKNFKGEWDRMPEDPLILLIAHSDCDGVIHPEHGRWLADRLAELLPKLPDEDAGGHIGNWRDKTQAFVDGLRAAVAAGEDVVFA